MALLALILAGIYWTCSTCKAPRTVSLIQCSNLKTKVSSCDREGNRVGIPRNKTGSQTESESIRWTGLQQYCVASAPAPLTTMDLPSLLPAPAEQPWLPGSDDSLSSLVCATLCAHGSLLFWSPGCFTTQVWIVGTRNTFEPVFYCVAFYNTTWQEFCFPA